MWKKLRNKLFNKQMLVLVELDRKKFKAGIEKSCDIYACIPKMSKEERELVEKYIESAIDIIRKNIKVDE
jgi:hypothetical protein